jgi:hypothetical protein
MFVKSLNGPCVVEGVGFHAELEAAGGKAELFCEFKSI